jgi:hypothetical protein
MLLGATFRQGSLPFTVSFRRPSRTKIKSLQQSRGPQP